MRTDVMDPLFLGLVLFGAAFVIQNIGDIGGLHHTVACTGDRDGEKGGVDQPPLFAVAPLRPSAGGPVFRVISHHPSSV